MSRCAPLSRRRVGTRHWLRTTRRSNVFSAERQNAVAVMSSEGAIEQAYRALIETLN